MNYMPIINALHLTHLVVWVNNKGQTETAESPLLCADMSTEPPRIVPMVEPKVPEGAPVRRVLHDSAQKCWFDLADGTVLRDWKHVVAPLFSLWDARQPAPQPAAPALTTPGIGAPVDHWGAGQRARSPGPGSEGGNAPGQR